MLSVTRSKRLTLVLLSLAAAGCESSAQPGKDAAAASPRPLEGFGDLKFGSSFTDIMGSLGAQLFNPAGVSDCFKDLPLNGCFLSGNMQKVPYVTRDGVPYMLHLEFNKRDKLTDIDLQWDREGSVTFEQCVEILERTLDWVAVEFGPLYTGSIKGKSDVEVRKTIKGNRYEIGRTGDTFVTIPMRTSSFPLRADAEKLPITQWDNQRYVSMFGHFLLIGSKPMCLVSVSFSEPQSVERRPSSDV